jgi:4-hydroxy-tetrahydrodipicolinate synthase
LPSYEKGEARDWAHEQMHGCANTVLASYTHDLSGLNEAGIRHDVRREVELGFSGALLVGETALTADEYIAFTRIAVDEADGALQFLFHASFNTLEENIAVANRADDAGAELVLLTYPSSFYPKTNEDIYRYTKAFCDGTDLAVVLFPVPLWDFERLHGASIAPAIVDRLLDDCPNIVAIKAEGGFPSIAGFVDLHKRVGDRVIVTMPVEDQAIPLKDLVPMQWMGTSYMEYLGDVVPRMFGLMESGDREAAMELFWQIHPARRAGHQLMASALGANFSNRMAWKYMGWLNGMNGGPLRMPTMRITGAQMQGARRGLERSGLPVTADEDALFYVGRTATTPALR